jgi:cytochrome c oxidase subunit IV
MSTSTATAPEKHTADAHTAHDDHSKRPYLPIFWALLALTIIEVSTIFWHFVIGEELVERLHFIVVVPFLMAIAIGKAALVAAYYMHLRYDPRWLLPVFIGPFVLAVLFGIIILVQY